ncbi:MAG TPA: MlaD family protein [bacterium]|nr:MlaD family protein [bacterium]HPS29025.1 MlaD family protein [bacterium]
MNSSTGFKVGIFLILSLLLIIISVFFLLVKKEFFTDHSYYTLSSPSGEGITEGMPLLFSGFEIGKVETLELDDAGNVIISVKVPSRHTLRINKSSTFTLEKPFIGSPRFVVKTPDKKALQPERNFVFPTDTIDDINEVIKKLQPMVEKVDQIATNVNAMTSEKSDLNKIISNLEAVTKDLSQKQGVVEMLAGDKKSGNDFRESVTALNGTLKVAEKLVSNANDTLKKADDQLLGNDGTIPKVNRIIDDVERKMKELDSLVSSLVKSGGSIESGTKDLDMLRKDIDLTINSVNLLIKDVRNNLPMEQKKEIKLP